MKKISHLSTVSSIVVLAFIVPQIAFAAWWNPISWFGGWSFFHRTDTQTQVLENRVKELEKKLESTATSTPVITTKTVAPTETRVVETPAPKKVSPVVVPVQIVAPVQPAVVPADSQLLMIEKCKAKRDADRASSWPGMLDAVRIGEQQVFQSTLNTLMAMTPPGTVPASSLTNAAKISDAEHERNLQKAASIMEARLAKEYSACLSGN
ncbi:MAG: hypothetical protein Q7R65_03705 [bacterium]|nr:hypothetical protein [bacterium]